MYNPPEVQDSTTAIQFVYWCIERLDMGYHPDSPFSDYVDAEGRQVFSAKEAHHLDQLNDLLFNYIDPYEIGMAAFRKKMGYAPDSDERLLETA